MIFAGCLTEDEELDKLADYTYEALKAAHDKEAAQGRGKGQFRYDDGEILCKTEQQAEGVADFLEDLGFQNVTTGYYDPEEDKRNNEVDDRTGWYYIRWE